MKSLSIAVISAVALLVAGASSASAAPQYWLSKNKTAPSTHCYAGYGYVDLSQVFPVDATSATFTGGARMACTQPFPAGAQLAAGSGTMDLWFTNTNRKSCTTTWWLYNNATATHAGDIVTGVYYGGPAIYVPANTTTPTKFTINFWVPDRTLLPDDQLQLHVNVRTASGSCSNMTLYYGSTLHPSNISLPTLVG
jgi:hypothetical protein